MTRLKIAVASSGLGHVARGVEAWAHDLGHAFVERDIRVVLCKGGGQREAEFERVLPCLTRESRTTLKIRRWLPKSLGWRIGLGSGYQIEQASFAWNLIKVLRNEKIDILHVQDPQVAVLVQRAARLGWVRTRTVLAHGTEEPLDFLMRITYLQHLAPWHLEEARQAGVWKPTWTAIGNFVDTASFRPRQPAGPGASASAIRRELGIPADAVVVLSAAAIKRRHKRVEYVLSEVGALCQSHPELPLYLILAGGWETDTDALVEEGKQRLGDRVRFLVRFPRAQMPELYRAADLFVLGSLKEMMPIALLEATGSGLPCITNEHPVMQWMTGPGGVSHDLSQPGQLRQAIHRLVADQDERARLGRIARQYCVNHFGREAVVDQILEYYQVVMRAHA